jgi:hypothetical protein
MKTICPACGAVASLDALLTDAEGREFVALIPKVPQEIQPVFLRYLALFRPKGRALQWRKASRLLTDLLAEVGKGHIQAGTCPARPAPVSVWAAAVQRIIDTPPVSLPLQNHNYLKKIVWDIADVSDREREKQQNAMERTHAYTAPRPETEPSRPLSLEEIKAIRDKNMKRKNTIGVINGV